MAARSFGKYEVLARLATGGAASIFLARQAGAAGFSKLVCLKTLLAERAVDADFVAMFLDEARLAARLNHPNCVQIYDLGRVRGVYYISMEYIFGETLWNLLTTVTKLKTPLPPPHVAAIVAAACDGLHHAHDLKDAQGKAYNLVHRDVSPQNIMITFEGQTKVVDFGIAKAETGRAATSAGIVKGKFSYMSPEQITGGAVDRRSDIFSLGIVLFECLASRRLYRGDTPEEIARLILEHRAPRLRDVVPDMPMGLDEICATALARHPSKRYQSAQEMGDALRAFMDSVRHNPTSSTTAKLMEDRFGVLIDNRRSVYESALLPKYDEARLLEVLDARAVRDLDLFPDGKPGTPDFHEETIDSQKRALAAVGRAAAVANVTEDSAGEVDDSVTGEVESLKPLASSKHPQPGFRVELQRASSRPTPISLLAEPGTAGEEDQVGPTHAELVRYDDVAEEAEGRTVFDPRRSNSQAGGETDPPGGVTAPPRASTGFADTIIRRPIETHEWNDATRETDFGEHTPFDGVNGATPEQSMSGPDMAAGLPTPEHPLKAARMMEPDELVTGPPLEAADIRAIAPTIEPRHTPRPQLTPEPIKGFTPRPQVTPPPNELDPGADRRYGPPALLVALGLGIVIGLSLGILVSHRLGSSQPAPVVAPSAPVTPP